MDEIRELSGILEKGYGPAIWFVFRDPSISIQAKAIYADICSMLPVDGTGKCYPLRDTIMSNLNLRSKGQYYKGYNQLVDLGLICIQKTVRQEDNTTYFDRNIYSLNLNPKSFIPPMKASVRFNNILDYRYGILPRKVLTDPEISYQAKALFAFYCAFGGAYPDRLISKDKTLYSMNICESELRRYHRQLKKYMQIKLRRGQSGKGSEYEITLLDEETIKAQKMQNSPKRDTVIVDNSAKTFQNAPKRDTVKRDTVKRDTVKRDAAKRDTIINNSNTNKNNINNNKSDDHHRTTIHVTDVPDEYVKKMNVDGYMSFVDAMNRIGQYSNRDAAIYKLEAFRISQALYRYDLIRPGSVNEYTLSTIMRRVGCQHISNPDKYVSTVLANEPPWKEK